MKNQNLKVKSITVNGYSLVNIRLWCNGVAFLHLAVSAVVILSIDVTTDEDPMVRAYDRVRWKLLTCVFNLVSLGYLPVCLYCDWWEKRGDEPSHVHKLRVLRDVVMTSILMPSTTYCDVIFWMLFRTYPQIIAPPRVFEYLSDWAQHSLHTISMVRVLMDLVLTPRQRPDSIKPGLTVMATFLSAYCVMVYISLLHGEPVYAFLATISSAGYLMTVVSSLGIFTVFYYAQWAFIDYIWGQKIINIDKAFVKIK